MFNFNNYKIVETIHSGKKNIIYKAFDITNNNPVILKLINKEYPSFQEIKHLKNEFEIAQNLQDIDGIVKMFDFIDDPNYKMIVMEEIEGKSLKYLIDKEDIDIRDFLKITIKTVEILGKIHRANVIHKDIKPSNIITDKNNNIWIIDFSLSTLFIRENLNMIKADTIEGSLPYISPEQTGRLNKTIDYRSDYYSLGVTFYEMITKTLPFTSQDPLELIHSHITKNPLPPHSIDERIPLSISNIIMKLLSKNQEDRYQSSYGILYDLKECFKQYETNRQIYNFEIAKEDRLEKFQIPEKIYGREEEINKLIQAFNYTLTGNTTVANIKGPSGIGKSTLTNKIKSFISEKKGYFISGKFDKFKQDIPYYALIQVIDDLGNQILIENEESLEEWKKQILGITGNIGKIITDISPIFETIIGKQHNLSEIGTRESQNRFNILMNNFLCLFATKEHPLVIFLDDMQWADNATITLFETLLSDNNKLPLLVIFSYRDNEIDQNKPFLDIIDKITKEKRLFITDIEVHPFKKNNIIEMLKDIFQKSGEEKLNEIADLIMSKTMGNPFFIREFLFNLHSENLISYNNEWIWDIEKIRKSHITDNVIDLMVNKIKKLPEEVLLVIKVSSCIDNWIYFDTLIYATDLPENKLQKYVYFLVNEGMLIKHEYNYQFVHDKVREAAYNICTEEERKKYHYSIGKSILLIYEKEEKKKDKYVFGIVNHWNLCISILKNEEKEKLSILNCQAGNKAKLSGAFSNALSFFNIAVSLLPNDKWESNYKNTFDLYKSQAEVEVLTSNFYNAEKNFSLLLLKSKNKLDTAEAYFLQILKLNNQGNYLEAYELVNKTLKLFGYSIPSKFSPFHLLIEFLKSSFLLFGKDKNKLLNLPDLKDEEKLFVLKIYSFIGIIFLNINNDMLPYLALKTLNLTLKYGNSKNSPTGYIYYGIFLSMILKDIKKSYEFGQIGWDLVIKYNTEINKGKILSFLEVLINYKIENTKKNLDKQIEAFQYSAEVGDLQGIVYSISAYLMNSFLCGIPLDFIQKEMGKYIKYFIDIKEKVSNRFITVLTNLLNELLVENTNDIFVIPESVKENVDIDYLEKENDKLTIICHYILKVITNYINENYESSNAIFLQENKYLKYSMLFIYYPLYLYYKALTIAASYEKFDKKEKKFQIKILDSTIKKFKLYADNNKFNFIQKYLLIKAEYYKIRKKYYQAEQLYNQAIKYAEENEYLNDEAIANECFAKFYFEIGIKNVGILYIQKAYYCYHKLGFSKKVSKFEKKYKNYISQTILPNTLLKKTFSDSTTSSTEALDIDSIMKASVTISGEIEIKRVIEKMMKIVIQSAGADKGILILLNERDELRIEAEAYSEKEEVLLLQSIPLDETEILSESMVRFAFKTIRILNLNDKGVKDIFINDKYLKKYNPKSVLVYPLLK